MCVCVCVCVRVCVCACTCVCVRACLYEHICTPVPLIDVSMRYEAKSAFDVISCRCNFSGDSIIEDLYTLHVRVRTHTHTRTVTNPTCVQWTGVQSSFSTSCKTQASYQHHTLSVCTLPFAHSLFAHTHTLTHSHTHTLTHYLFAMGQASHTALMPQHLSTGIVCAGVVRAGWQGRQGRPSIFSYCYQIAQK